MIINVKRFIFINPHISKFCFGYKHMLLVVQIHHCCEQSFQKMIHHQYLQSEVFFEEKTNIILYLTMWIPQRNLLNSVQEQLLLFVFLKMFRKSFKRVCWFVSIHILHNDEHFVNKILRVILIASLWHQNFTPKAKII